MRWLGAVAGLLVTAAGVVVLLTPTPAPPAQVQVQATVPAPVAVLAPEAVRTVPHIPADLPGLDADVATLLADTGYASFATDEDLRGLPPEVVATLIANGAVLVVPESSTTQTLGGT